MDGKQKKSLIRASGIAVILVLLSIAVVSIKGCTGRPNDGGGTAGSGDVGPALGPETSSLFGAMETLGVFDVAVNSAVVTPVSASPMVSLSVTKLSASPLLTLSVEIANTTSSTLEGVVMRLGPLGENVLPVNNDGHHSYNFGDIAAGQGITKDDIQFEGAPASFNFRLYITQKKPHAKSGVVAYGASGGAGASLSAGKSLSKDKDKSLELIHRVKTLSSPRAVTHGGIISQGAHISTKADSAGNVKISYLDVDNHDLRYSFWWLDADLSDGDQSGWRHVTVEDSGGKTGYFSSLALTSLGNPRIAYYSSEDSSGAPTQDLKYAYCNTDCEIASNWGTVTIDATGDTGGYTSIGLDFDGNPRISYYDFTNRDLKYAFCNAGAACNDSGNWTIITIDSTGYVGQFTSMALDPNTAMPRISYYDYSNGDLKYAYCDVNCNLPASWTKTTLDSSGDVGTYTSLALDGTTGYARISYYDIGNMDLKFAFYDQLASSNLGPAQTVAAPAYCTTWGTCYDSYGSYTCCTAYYYDVTFDNQAYSPDIIQTDSSNYKLYYTNITPVCLSYDYYGDCTGYRYTDGALVYKTTTDTNPPQASSSNMDIMRQSLNTGGTQYDSANDPEVVRLSTLRYRLYYSWYNGSYYQLAYKDTSDTNPPSGTNLGAQQLLNVGTGTLDQAEKPNILLLTSGYYRLYYGYNNGSYNQLAYRDTTTMNPPSSSNLGPVKFLNIGYSSYYSVSGPEVVARTGGYRLYYDVNNSSGGAAFLAYRDTTNANPPDDTANFGDEQGLGLGTTSNDRALDPHIVQLSNGKYRLYYSWYNGSYWQVVYRETVDTNLPGASTTCCGWNVLTVDSYEDSGAFSSVGIDPAGSFFVSYYYSGEAYGASGNLKYVTCDAGPLCNSRGRWVHNTLDADSDTGWFTSVSVTASGMVYVGYYNSANKNLMLGALRLFMPTDAIDPGANNGRFHSLKLDANDYPHIGYAVYDSANRLNNAIKYAYWDGAVWKKVTLDSAPTDNTVDWQPHISLDLNSAGKPRLLYAWNRSQLKYASCDTACSNASNWTKTTLTGVTPDPFTLPPYGGNIGAQQDLISGSEQGGPEIVLVPSTGKYRIYYHKTFAVCSTWVTDRYGVTTCSAYIYPFGLVYRETTNTSPPAASCSNCGAETSLGIGGTATNDQAEHPNVIQLSDGKFRLYYSYYNGSYWQLAYRETYDNTDPPAYRGTTRYENTSASITKSGTWTTGNNGSASGGSYIASKTTSNYAQLVFTGTGVSWIGLKSYNQGIGSVYLDGVLQGTVDLYRAPTCDGYNSYGQCWGWTYTVYQQTLWSISGLTYGSHTIRILVSGTKNASSSDYYVNVDAIDVTYSYPNNMGAPVLISTGSSASNMARAPEVFARPGGYRMYYSYSNGTYYQLAYKDTTDANPPQTSCTNCGAQQLMGIGSSTNPAYTNEVVQLPDGTYRLYYGYSNGSYYQLAYYDTSNTSLPDAANLTVWSSLATGSGTYDRAYAPNVIQLASSGWRLYYQNYYACSWDIYGVPTGGCWKLAFKDTVSTTGTAQRYVGPSLALDGTGRPRISYEYNSAVEYSYCDSSCSSASSWSPMTADSSVGDYAASGISSATQTSIALDSSGNPRLAYYMQVTGDLRYSYCDSGCGSVLSWVKTTVASSNYSGRYASLYLDISNRPRIAHEEYAGTLYYLDYSYCDSNCGSSSNWLTARNINGASTWNDQYGVYYFSNQKGYNNPLKIDQFGGPNHIDFMYGGSGASGSNTLSYGYCLTGCSSTGSWAKSSYGTNSVGWTDFDIDSVGTVHSAYYIIDSGLYYEWRWVQ